jgi:hypothetical protein
MIEDELEPVTCAYWEAGRSPARSPIGSLRVFRGRGG